MALKDFVPNPELHRMAAHELPDLDQLARRLVVLERLEDDVVRQLDRLLDRQGQFPSELTARRITETQTKHLELRREMNTIRARLLPIMRVPSQ